MHIDNLLEHLRPYGPYQILNWLALTFFATFFPAWHQFAIIFTAYFPSEYGCSGTRDGQNWTLSDAINKYPNDDDGNVLLVKTPIQGHPCLVALSVYSGNSSDALLLSSSNETCSSNDNFWFTTDDPVKSTIITQWNLVCSRELLFTIISAAEGLGEVFGCVVIGYIADRIGRKKALFLSAAVLFVSGLLCAFAPNPVAAIIARILIGFSLVGMLNIGFLMNTELFTSKGRTLFTAGGEILWAIGICALTGIGYVARDEFSFMLAITLPLLLMIPCWWILRESIHWELANARAKEAEVTLRRIAKFNKVEMDEVLLRQVLEEDIAQLSNPDEAITKDVKSSKADAKAEQRSPLLMEKSANHDHEKNAGKAQSQNRESNALDLFRTKRLRAITIFLTLLWFANTICYYGLQLAAQLAEGVDFYLSFFILSAVEIPSTIAVIPFMLYAGRRRSIVIFQTLAGVSCAVVAFIPAVLYVYAAELMPTSLRGIGFGVISVIGRVGMVAAPFVNALGVGEVSTSVPSWLRMFIYGIILIVTGFLTIPLPETNNNPLPDTVEQIEHYDQYCKEYHERIKREEQKKQQNSSL